MVKQLTRADIMPMDKYAAIRREKAREIAALKRDRRMEVGPHATFYFESFDTMWRQVHEMLFIEKGGEEQITDELEAYNPLIPNGRELVATLMFEIDDRSRRQRILGQLGGVEETVELRIGDSVVKGEAETDVDRTTADGKASSVHFLHFPFTGEQIEQFRDPKVQVMLGITHRNYEHMAAVPDRVRTALIGDFEN